MGATLSVSTGRESSSRPMTASPDVDTLET